MGNYDYIRRILAKAQFTGNFQDEYPTAQIHALIDTVPAEDVQPVVHGKWIPVTNGRGGCECNMCHAYAPSYQSGSEYKSHFCPNCGAIMDLFEENADI